MRRIVVTGAVVALVLGFSGCGDSANVGVPTDAPKPKSFDMSDKFDKMKGAIATKGKKAVSIPAGEAPIPTSKD